MFGQNPIARPFRDTTGALRIKEFYHTIQGEGPQSGEPAWFLRLAGCNLRCFFCDTAFDDGDLWSFKELCEKVDNAFDGAKSDLLVITGGEPLLQNIVPLVDYANRRKIRVSVETAGTVWQEGLEARFYWSLGQWLELDVAPYSHWDGRPRNFMVVSPKTPKIDVRVEIAMRALKYIVVAGCLDPEDGLPFYSTQHPVKKQLLYKLTPSLRHDVPIYLQPCDSHDLEKTKENIWEAVAACLKFGYRLSLQTHKIVGLP